MPRPKRTEKDKYGETKLRYQIMLTETASSELDKIAEELGITRSEVLERAIRQGLLTQVTHDVDDLDIDER